jgi:xanthine dehydrogenase accessory factor
MSAGTYIQLKRELDKGKKAVVVTTMSGGEDERTKPCKLLLTEEQLFDPDKIHTIDAAMIQKAQLALTTGKLQYDPDGSGGGILAEPYFPEPRLIVLGGGHIAKPLVEFGAKVGFQVTVVDDRPMFADKDRFPDAEKVLCERFDNCIAQLGLNENAFVVIMIREHRHDLECLKQLLSVDTAFIGMIGSKRSVDFVKAQLLTEGFPEALTDRVNAPVGLDIGAKTPEEIAISIIAQLISRRKTGTTFDRSVLEELCNEADDPKALVTIIATEGSVPRKTGTKMLVWPYGMTKGSVGGGYAEGEIINAAWQIIGSGGSVTHDLDMTGQIAEEEGMICGGIMRTLIEDCRG